MEIEWKSETVDPYLFKQSNNGQADLSTVWRDAGTMLEHTNDFMRSTSPSLAD